MRNRILIPSLIVLMGIIFIFGLSVGVYKIFPYDVLNSSLDIIKEKTSPENSQFVIQTDLDSLIQINDELDVEQKRGDLIEFFWDVGSLNRLQYDAELPEIESGISDSRYNNFQNLKRIDRSIVEMDYGVNSISYIFIPEESNKKLIFYHHGHDGDFILGKNTIQFFLDRNFTVIAMTMPLIGMNNQPIIEIDGFGQTKLISHDQFRLLESDTFNPMKLILFVQIHLFL